MQHFPISVWNPWHQRIYSEVKWGGCCMERAVGAELAGAGGVHATLMLTGILPVARAFFSISSLLTLLPSRPAEWGRFKWPVKWNPQGLAGVRSGFIIYRHLCPIMSLSPSVTMMMPCVYTCVCVCVCVCRCVCVCVCRAWISQPHCYLSNYQDSLLHHDIIDKFTHKKNAHTHSHVTHAHAHAHIFCLDSAL